MFKELKGISLKRDSDIIEIKLRDNAYKKYYEGKANINDKKQMIKLLKELEEKGVDLRKKSGWFD